MILIIFLHSFKSVYELGLSGRDLTLIKYWLSCDWYVIEVCHGLFGIENEVLFIYRGMSMGENFFKWFNILALSGGEFFTDFFSFYHRFFKINLFTIESGKCSH